MSYTLTAYIRDGSYSVEVKDGDPLEAAKHLMEEEAVSAILLTNDDHPPLEEGAKAVLVASANGRASMAWVTPGIAEGIAREFPVQTPEPAES